MCLRSQLITNQALDRSRHTIRLRNMLVPGTEAGWTVHLPDGERMTIYDAALKYQAEKVPLIIIAGKGV